MKNTNGVHTEKEITKNFSCRVSTGDKKWNRVLLTFAATNHMESLQYSTHTQFHFIVLTNKIDGSCFFTFAFAKTEK